MQALIRCTTWLIIFWRTILTFNFYSNVIYELPFFIRLRFHEIFKKRSWNKLERKNLWKCRSRRMLQRMLTHCIVVRCTACSATCNKSKMTENLESSMSFEVFVFWKDMHRSQSSFIEDFYQICIAEWIYRVCFGYEIQRDWKMWRWVCWCFLSLNFRPEL